MARCIRCGTPLPTDATRRRVFCTGACRVAHHRQRQAEDVQALRDELAAFTALVERHGLVGERRALARFTATPELAATMRAALEAGRRAQEAADGM